MAAQEIIESSRTYADGWVKQADQLVQNLTTKIETADDKFGLGKTTTIFDRPAINLSQIDAISLSVNPNATDRLYEAATEKLDNDSPEPPEQIAVPTWDVGRLPEKVIFDSEKYQVEPFNEKIEFKATDYKVDEFNETVQFNSEQYKIEPFDGSVEFDFSKYTVPEFSEAAPAVDFGSPPVAFSGEIPAKNFTVGDVSIPKSFDIDTPAPPTLLGTINLPSPPSIEFPQTLAEIDWDFVADVGDASFGFTFNDSAYTSALMDSVTAKLLHDLANGGYGIEVADEAGLWERGREREAAASQAEMQAITRDFASRGFMVPPGALFGAVEGIRAKAMAAASTLSREVALKRADLYVQNRQFTIEQVKELEVVLLNQHMAVMERVLKAAQISAQFVVDQYRARLDKAKAQADVVQLRVQSFRDLVAAESSKIEVYNAQIRAELAKTEVDKNKIDAYRAQLAGVESTVNVYRLHVQAAEAAIQVERSKVEMWKIEVDGYIASIRAKEAEFSGYEARIRGEQAKVQVFSEQVRAHAGLVEAKKTEAGIKEMEVRAFSENVKAHAVMVDAKKTEAGIKGMEVQAFSEKVKAHAVMVDAKKTEASIKEMEVRVFSEKVKAHAAKVDAKRAEADIKRMEVSAYADASNIAFRAFESELSANKHANELYSRSHENEIRLYDAKTRAYGTKVEAASKLASANIDLSRLSVDARIQSAKLLLEATLAEINADFKATGFVVDSQQKLVDMYKDMIGASLGALNSIASISE
ncbi:MAG: hypothetical protein RLZ68_1131 [Pseudomonadota bacterium]|jgi:hypothetical protein